ncbi:hypothetical protein V495_05464 [Pseudogymnoascus sp. VKM F-4514 (FW-929)]|nr:hypothetical protein V495_05464 [Pseudogymnoascus sp. VKM F-4514 (FW-929)]
MGLINDACGALGLAFEHTSGSLGRGVKFDVASIPSQSGKVILITGGTQHRARPGNLPRPRGAPASAHLPLRSLRRQGRSYDQGAAGGAARRTAQLPAARPGGFGIRAGRTVEIPGADVRVVTVSSVGHHLAPAEGVEFAALKGGMGHLTTWNRYAQSKLANRLFAKQLAERYPKIMSVSVHPGVVTTNLYTAAVGDVGLKKMAYWGFKTALSVSVDQGSKNQLWAATSPREGLVPGEYYFPVGILGKGSKQGEDEELGKKLWEWTEKELEGYTL